MVGRHKEIKELNRLYDSGRAELVAIYGRRRVGKTFLVDETFSGRITFRHAGLSPADNESEGLLHAQLDHFYNLFQEAFYDMIISESLFFDMRESLNRTGIKRNGRKGKNYAI